MSDTSYSTTSDMSRALSELSLNTLEQRSIGTPESSDDFEKPEESIEVDRDLIPQQGVYFAQKTKIVRRNLPGVLGALERETAGKRSLGIEWCAHNSIIDKIQHQNDLVLYFGTYHDVDPVERRQQAWRISAALETRVLACDYNQADASLTSLHDAVSAWLYLTRDLGISADQIVIIGEELGGGLAIGLQLYLIEHNLELPHGSIIHSPVLDFSYSLYSRRFHYQELFQERAQEMINEMRGFYFMDSDFFDNPFHSPIHATTDLLERLPPVLVQVEENDPAEDDANLFAQLADRAETDIQLQIFGSKAKFAGSAESSERVTTLRLPLAKDWLDAHPKPTCSIQNSYLTQINEILKNKFNSSLAASRENEPDVHYKSLPRNPRKLKCNEHVTKIVQDLVEEINKIKARDTFTHYYRLREKPGRLTKIHKYSLVSLVKILDFAI